MRETGKGYPDVTSLMALSEIFNVSVNELLAGKRLTQENIKETADKNIISVIEESQKAKKKHSVQFAVYTAILIVISLPSLFLSAKELFSVMSTQIQRENIISAVVVIFVAIVLLIVGSVIKKGHLSILHSYHYKNVTDTAGYAKELGNAVMFMCIPVFTDGFLTLFAHIKAVSVISSVLLFTGLIICAVYIFKVQIKYNGGLF